jgi:carbon monoxide dehydrogenase subunit G
MAGFELSERIDRSPGEVWGFFIDQGNLKRWMPDIVRLEKVTDGPVRLGTRYRETRRMGGKEHTVTLEITAFDEGRRYAGTVDEKGVRGTYTYTFEPDGDATRVRMVADVKGRGLMKLMVPMFVGMMKKQDGGQLERLKRALEA